MDFLFLFIEGFGFGPEKKRFGIYRVTNPLAFSAATRPPAKKIEPWPVGKVTRRQGDPSAR
jgi:hypothetical protein